MKAFKTKMMVGAVAAAVLTIGAAQAAESVKTDEIKVTATRVEKELSDVNMSVSVITEEQIKHSTARNVGELLKDTVGIEINPDGGQGVNRANIRGENAFRTVVMIDGQKIAEHKSMSGAPMLIDPAMIERIEVIKGPVSVLYGSDAIGGAINIITKKGGDRPFQGNVTAGYNTSADAASGSASVAGSTNGWNYRLSAAYEDSSDLETPVGDMYNTDFNTKSAGLFVSYDINPDVTVGATLDYYDMEFHAGDFESNNRFGKRSNGAFRVDVDDWKRTKGALFAEIRNVNETLQRVRIDTFYQEGEKSMVNTIAPMTGLPPKLSSSGSNYVQPKMIQQPIADNTMDQYGLSIQTDWQLNENNYLVAGYEMSYDDMDARTQQFQHFSMSVGPRPNMMFPMFSWNEYTKDETYDGYQASHALYASMETILPHDFTINYGARYTYVESEMDITGKSMTYHDLANQQGMFVPEITSAGKDISRDTDDGKVVFNAGVIWTGVENLTLRANYAQGYRTPMLQELYIDTSMGGANQLANPNLKPETSDNFEIGARWSNGKAMVDATIFYSDADDYIDTISTGGANNETKQMNIAKAKTYGLELTASAYIGETGFEPYVNLTMMKRQFDQGYDGVNSHKSKSWDTGTPLVTAVYGVRWAGEKEGLGVRWDAYLRSQSSSKYEDLNWKIDPENGKVKSGAYDYAGYTTFNLTGGIDFGAQKQYTVDFGLYNVFDKLYQHQGAIYEPGRYAAVKFNAQF